MRQATIVGAGITGATIARMLAENDFKVIVIDKRDHIGGNLYDEIDSKNSLLIQKYGPHIFHTNKEDVYKFLSRFTVFLDYEHRVLGNINGKFVPIPFSLRSVDEYFSNDEARKIQFELSKEFDFGSTITLDMLRSSNNETVRKLGDWIYKNVFKKYSKKQWGFDPKYLQKSIVDRIPFKFSYEDKYFQDKYQGMPKLGFTNLIKNMLRHENIDVRLNTDAKDFLNLSEKKISIFQNCSVGVSPLVIYTGSIDELFDYKYGKLDYRTLDFEFKTLQKPSFQSRAVVNYNTSKRYTRITEFKKFPYFRESPTNTTVICKEYPRKHKRKDIPYYPIESDKMLALYNRYIEETVKYRNLFVAGRLGAYKYMNIDVAVEQAMFLAKILINDFR